MASLGVSILETAGAWEQAEDYFYFRVIPTAGEKWGIIPVLLCWDTQTLGKWEEILLELNHKDTPVQFN